MAVAHAREILQKHTTELNDLKELDINEMFRYIISCGDTLPALSQHELIEQYYVQGCISNAYVKVAHEGERVHVYGYAEAAIVKGFMAMLSQCCRELTPLELHEHGKSIIDEFLQGVNLSMMISPTRANAFGLIVDCIIQRSRQL